MSYNPERYRTVEFVGGRILQARELANMQEMARGVDANRQPTAFLLDGVFREGATINVTASISGGNTVTLVPTDPTLPMLVFARGQWEQLQTSEAPPVLLTNPQIDVYLNWELHQITSADDPTLIDTTTGEPTANMGELRMSVSNTDTSAVPLASNQYEKNIAAVVLFRYQWQGGAISEVPFTVAGDGLAGNVKKQALADSINAGLVRLTTDTSGGTAVADDDPRNSNDRTPLANSVNDSKMQSPVGTGNTNPDGTDQYDLNSEPGGIGANKVVYIEGTQLVSDAITLIKHNLTVLTNAYNTHQGAPLGQLNTHPFPTAVQVGAAPASHVNMPLGVLGSHPAQVNSSDSGFSVARDPSVPPPPNSTGFVITESGTPIVALKHNGDVFSKAGSPFVANPLVESGDPTLASGNLSSLGLIAQVLAQHVNKYPHKNPHGLTLDDLGGAGVSKAYVDSQDAATLASAETYANSLAVHARVSNFIQEHFSNGSAQFVEFTFSPNGGTPLFILIGSGKITTNGTEYHQMSDYLPAGYANYVANIHVEGIPFGPGVLTEVNTSYGGGTFYGWQKRYNGNEGYVGPFGVDLGFWTVAWHN